MAPVLDDGVIALDGFTHAGQRLPVDDRVSKRRDGHRFELPTHPAVEARFGAPRPEVGGMRHASDEVAAGGGVVGQAARDEDIFRDGSADDAFPRKRVEDQQIARIVRETRRAKSARASRSSRRLNERAV